VGGSGGAGEPGAAGGAGAGGAGGPSIGIFRGGSSTLTGTEFATITIGAGGTGGTGGNTGPAGVSAAIYP
jgi:hypothetical protein